MTLKQIHSTFKDPWKKAHQWFFKGGPEENLGLDIDPGGHVRWGRNMLTEAQKSKIRTDVSQRNAAGERSFKGADQTIDEEGQEMKEELITALEDFQAATHIDQTDTIAKVEKCISKGDIEKIKNKLHKKGLEYTEKNLIGKHAVFKKTPGLKGLDEPTIKANKEHYLSWAKNLPLFAKNKEDSLAHFIENFEEFIAPRVEFKEKLGKQSLFIQELFYQELNKKKALDPKTSETQVLTEILEEMEPILDAPEVVQKEFKALSNSNKTPGERANLTLAAFEKRMSKYKEMLFENMQYFGGEMVNTPDGKMREAAKEFMEWMEKRESFDDMDANIKLFTTHVLPKRKAVYEKRDELLDHLPKGMQGPLIEKTNQMRFHTLEAYIEDIKDIAKTASIHVLEYHADLENAEEDKLSLFNDEEKVDRKQMIKIELPEFQDGEVKRLNRVEIPERKKIHQEYADLPEYLKNDKKFVKMNIYDKRAYLRDAQKRKDIEKKNPFAVLENKMVTKAQKKNMLIRGFRSKEGREQLQRKMKGEKAAEAFENISEVTNRVGKYWHSLEQKDNSQMEGRFEEDVAYGLRGMDKDTWKVGFGMKEAKNETEQFYGNTFVTDYMWRLAEEDRTSGGHIVNQGLQVIDNHQWESGDNSMIDALDNTPYDSMAMFLGEDGRDELHLTKKNAKIFMRLFMQLSNMLQRSYGLDGEDDDVIDAMNASIMDVDEEFAEAANFNNFDVGDSTSVEDGDEMAA